MRICIDIDGTLCALRQPGETYADVEPLPGAVERVREYRAAGHVVILATARHMQTCQGNTGLVIARQGKVLLDWLDRHGLEYDELHFGKPNADVYIDDRAVRFEGDWAALGADALPRGEGGTKAAVEPRAERPAAPAPARSPAEAL